MNDDFKTFYSNEEPGLHEMNEKAKAFADEFQAWLKDHEEVVHDGERCSEERANLVGYLIHRIGFGPKEWEWLLMVVEFYEEHHDAPA